jgi:hypothetical protein
MKSYSLLFLGMLTIGLLGSTLWACFSVSTGDGKTSGAAVAMNQEEKIAVVTVANFDRLKEDMARGQGDRLTAFAVLLQIPQEQQAEFFTLTQEKFPVLFPSGQVAANEMIATLTRELSYHPQIHSILAMD